MVNVPNGIPSGCNRLEPHGDETCGFSLINSFTVCEFLKLKFKVMSSAAFINEENKFYPPFLGMLPQHFTGSSDFGILIPRFWLFSILVNVNLGSVD